MEEGAVDFRVGPGFLSKVSTTVFGLGNSIYETHFNTVAKKVRYFIIYIYIYT